MNKVKTEGLKYSNDVKPPVVLRVPDDSPGRGSHMDTGSLLATSGSAAHQKPSRVWLNTPAGRSRAIPHPSSSPNQQNKGDIFPSSTLFYFFASSFKLLLLLPCLCGPPGNPRGFSASHDFSAQASSLREQAG